MFKKVSKSRSVRVVLKVRGWKRIPMKLLKWGRKMPSTQQQYDLVPNDEYDTRIPLHPDEAFQYGITFHAKYIGTMDVPRPSSRVEIVAAMRRVRYEFKAKGVKKRKVVVDVSTDGVKVTTRKKKSKLVILLQKLRRSKTNVDSVEIMHHPIYRIFYVSHDSSDLKIFSYIARDGATNVFKCNVFKSNRKSQAMRIVRTVGQAFEVCHKMQTNMPDQPVASTSSAADELVTVDITSEAPASKEGASDCGVSESVSQSGGASTSKVEATPPEVATRPQHLELLPPPPRKEGKRSPQRITTTPSINLPELPECITKVDISIPKDDADTPLSSQHQLQLLRERLEQQAQQTQAAVAQLLLLRDQLAVEQAARCEAQTRTHQLLVHNRELLEHISALVAHLQERERGTSRPISAQQLLLLPQKVNTAEVHVTCNGNEPPLSPDTLIDLFSKARISQSLENNNNNASSPKKPIVNGPNSKPNFDGMSNEQIQDYLIAKFQDIGSTTSTSEPTVDNSQEFYQNRQAFPNIPPVTSHFSNADLANLLNHSTLSKKGYSSDKNNLIGQAMSLGQSDNSLYSKSSQASSSKDSSPDGDAFSSDEGGVPFIMPLSHNGTLTATGEDGRVRLIVPVSPSESTNNVTVADLHPEPQKPPAGQTLTVPGIAPAAPITRTTSEKVPNRSEMMTVLRQQWTRHTTK